MIPFTTAEFLRVFEQYNSAVWPGQVLIYLIGLAAIVLAFTRRAVASKLISLILSLFWLWMGVVYHLIFFSEINKAARLFGALFIVQSLCPKSHFEFLVAALPPDVRQGCAPGSGLWPGNAWAKRE